MTPVGEVADQNEQEVLLQPGTPLYIDAIVPRANNIIEIQAHEVPAGGATNANSGGGGGPHYSQGFAMSPSSSGAMEQPVQGAELPSMEEASYNFATNASTLPRPGGGAGNGSTKTAAAASSVPQTGTKTGSGTSDERCPRCKTKLQWCMCNTQKTLVSSGSGAARRPGSTGARAVSIRPASGLQSNPGKQSKPQQSSAIHQEGEESEL
jgi:hypothetical protein